MTPFRLLITGSRNWPEPIWVIQYLNGILFIKQHELVIVHGACPKGVDKVASDWAEEVGVNEETYPAEWGRFGRGAGMRRNIEMVRTKPDACIAFIYQKSKGATQCKLMAERYGIPTDTVRI